MENHKFDTIDLMTYVTGGCGAHDSEVIGRHLATCDHCRSIVESLKAEQTHFIQKFPFKQFSFPAKTAPAPHVAFRFRMRHAYSLAASIACILTTGYFFLIRQPAHYVGIKGEEGLALYVQNASGVVEQRTQPVYRCRERIQFLYSCGARHAFMLLSMDTTGAVSRYYPAGEDSSTVLEPGQRIPLAHSIILDSYTGKELFLGIFSEKRQCADSVQRRIESVFKRTNSLDSITLPGNEFFIVKHYITVKKGPA